MFCLSQSVGYAIRSLTTLAAGNAGSGLIRDVAAASEVPAPYLAKLFKKLADAGLLKSKRGHKGGSWLTRPPETISLFEISNAIDGSGWLGSCLLGQAECSDTRACPTHEFWKTARAQIRKQLENTSLADVLAFETMRSAKGACDTLSLTPNPNNTHPYENGP